MARIVQDPGAKVAGNVSAQAAPTAQPPRASALALFWSFFWPLLSLTLLGMIGGWAYLQYTTTSHPQHPETSVEDTGKKIETGLRPGEAPTLERGDELLKEGRYGPALKVYEPLVSGASGTLKDALQYRVGLSLEGLGRDGDAINAYRVVVSKGENPRAVVAAEIGQARVHIRQHRPSEAKNLLYPVLLRSAMPELKDAHFLGDVRYLLAVTLVLEATRAETRPDAIHDALSDYTAADWPVELALDWVQPGKPDAEKPTDKETTGKQEGPPEKPRKPMDFVHVSLPDMKPGRGVEQATVSATVPPGLLSDLLARIAERARLKVEQTESAKKAILDRNTQANFENLPLVDVLLALTDPLGVAWSIKDGTLRLTTEVELTPQEVEAFRRTTARQALNSARLNNPGHRLTAAGYLELGNLDSRAGNWKDAAGLYERLRIELPRSPVNVDGQYNLGIARTQLGQLTEARRAFLAVVDINPGHALAPMAYLRIGRTYLLEGDANVALPSLQKAMGAATGTPEQGPAALTLACAYIMAKKPRVATALLRGKDRETVMRDDLRATALFLDAYGEYLSLAPGRAREEASEPLLSALLNLPEETPLGILSTLLVGQAYRDLGMTDQMIAVYEKAQLKLKGPVASEVAFAIADALLDRNRREEAFRRFLALTKMDNGPWVAQAQLRLADMAMQDRRPDECLTWCKKLLDAKPPTVEKKAILTLVGRAYESKGDYAKAAIAFSGKEP